MNLDCIKVQQPQKPTETSIGNIQLKNSDSVFTKKLNLTQSNEVIKSTVEKSTNHFHTNDRPTSPVDVLPKYLYLKKVVSPGLQLKTNTMKSNQEPIPKLIVCTKSIKMANQYDQPTEVRYVTATRKPEINDSPPVTKVDAIKSPKIIIKGITSQDKRLMVCESPTQESSPQLSPKLSPPSAIHAELNKNETRNTVIDEDASKGEKNIETCKTVSEDDQTGSSSDIISGTILKRRNDELRRYSGLKSPQKAIKESKLLSDFIADDVTPGKSREMKQLQKTLKESKILTDFITVGDSKERRAKRKLDDDHDENEVVNDPELIAALYENVAHGDSDTTNISDAMISIRRNTRSSLNAEFSAKQRKFLAGIHKLSRDSDDDHSDDEEQARGRRKINKKSGKSLAPLMPGYDKYCWQCHQYDTTIACTHCKRTYHMECLKSKQIPKNENQKLTWQCPECCLLEASINETEKAKYDFNELCTMLEFAHKRLKLTAKTLVVPSDESENIVTPVTFSTMEQKIINKQYQSTHAFLTDARWILHNCTIFYSRNAKLLAIAKTIFKICKQEMYDIDTCHECYYNANSGKIDWFVEVCSRPHILVWAKLKEFPYWPAKAMTTNSQGMVDVRFFGDHDRAFVAIRECFLYSEDHPSPITVKSKRQSIAHSVLEVNMYIKRLQTKFGSFVFSECKTLFDPFKEEEQLEHMIPNYKNYKNNINNKKSTSNSDLTYKIVKTADNNLSIVKKNDKNILPPEIESIKTKNMERKQGRTSSIEFERQNETHDDLLYQIMKSKRDSDSSRLDGRVDSVILKRKSDAPVLVGEIKKKLKLISDTRRMSTPIVTKQSSSDEKPKDSIEKLSKTRRATITKNCDAKQENAVAKQTDRRLSSIKLKDVSSKDVTGKSNSKEDLISSVVKTLDTLEAFVCTSDNSKLKCLEAHLSKTPEREIVRTAKNPKISSNHFVDKHPAVKLQCTEESNEDRVIETQPINNERKRDEDENLLMPMHDASIHELNDSKREIQMAAITSSRQGSMSGSSVKSVAGSLDEPFEISIKTEPTSDDERIDDALLLSNGHLEAIMSAQDNMQKSSSDNNVAKISVKNINMLTKPLTPMQRPPQTNRKMLNSKSVLRPDLIKQRARKSFLANPKNPIKSITASSSSTSRNIQHQQQSQNMVCIPMDRSNFQRIESITLGNHSNSNPPPLAAVSATPNITVMHNDQISQPKNVINYSSGTTVPSIGPPPLSLTTPLKLADPVSNTIVQPVQQSTISGTITDTFASAISDIMKHNEPKLTPKPVGPLRFESTNQLTSEAGHYSKILIDNSHKLADYFRSVFEVTWADIASTGCSEARIQLLELELEQSKLNHSKELEDIKSNYGMLLSDIKKKFEAEKSKLINETRRQCEVDRIRAVEDTKKRQWCVNCGKEAKFYCCWNTSYCDYPCQQQHWPRHMANCSQTEEFGSSNGKSYGSRVSDKGKELNQTQVKTAAMRHFNNPNIKNVTLSNTNNMAANNQSLQRVIAISHLMKNNTQKNAGTQYKIVNRLNPCVIMPTATSVSNAIITANTSTSNVCRTNLSSQNQ